MPVPALLHDGEFRARSWARWTWESGTATSATPRISNPRPTKDKRLVQFSSNFTLAEAAQQKIEGGQPGHRGHHLRQVETLDQVLIHSLR